jgi:hypothetical protein
MPRYEYKLVPAPDRATRHKGLKGAANFAATLEDVMNAMGAEGWTYLRADILPEEVRTGLTSRQTSYRSLLVFQREVTADAELPGPRHVPTRTGVPPVPEDDGDDDDPNLSNLFALEDEDNDDRGRARTP